MKDRLRRLPYPTWVPGVVLAAALGGAVAAAFPGSPLPHLITLPFAAIVGWAASPSATIRKTYRCPPVPHAWKECGTVALLSSETGHGLVAVPPPAAGLHHRLEVRVTTPWPWRWEARRVATFPVAPLHVAPDPTEVGLSLDDDDQPDADPAALRDWRPGDSAKQVAWRASARRGDDKLVVRDAAGNADEVVFRAETGRDGAARTLRTMMDLHEGGRRFTVVLPSGRSARPGTPREFGLLAAELVGEVE